MRKKTKATKAVREARGPRRPQFPAHLGCTPAEWRAKKQQEWREVVAALQRFTYGSAYAPGGAELYHLSRLAEQITAQVEPTDWVAW